MSSGLCGAAVTVRMLSAPARVTAHERNEEHPLAAGRERGQFYRIVRIKLPTHFELIAAALST
jgi:hypothetical protein